MSRTLAFAAFCCLTMAPRAAFGAASDDWNAPPVAASAPSAPAQTGNDYPRPENPVSFDYLKLIWSDAVETATEPAHWDHDDWRNAALIGGGLLFSMAVLDKPIKDAAQRNRSASTDRFFRDVQKFGTKQYGLPVLLGFYGYGALADDNEAKAVALDGFSASVISALVTSTIKGAVGRARPYTGLGPHHFAPLQSDYSFPSGHASGAFAFASVIATHCDSVWVDIGAYGVAGLVGYARIEQNAHWTSDVVAGALIGGLIGHHLVEFNRRLRAEHSAFAPTLSTDGQQLLVSWQF